MSSFRLVRAKTELVLDFLDAMKHMPGRKAIVLISNSVEVPVEAGDWIQGVADKALRCGVVIYTIDIRGLETIPVFSASERDSSIEAVQEALGTRAWDESASKDGLSFLAEQTGGRHIENSNIDRKTGLAPVLKELEGYYLVGYQPDSATFVGARDGSGSTAFFHRLNVRVKRPGVKLSYRSGFFGIADTPDEPRPPRTLRQLVADPFRGDAIDVRLTSYFMPDERNNLNLISLLHVDANRLTFMDEGDGGYSISLEALLTANGSGGNFSKDQMIQQNLYVPSREVEYIRKNGMNVRLWLPISEPGPYFLRVAARDRASGLSGTAHQFIEVPNHTKDLNLSGLVVGGDDFLYAINPNPVKGFFATAGPAAALVAALPPAPPNNWSGPGVRRFWRDSGLNYALLVFNPTRLPGGSSPELTIETRIFRQGNLFEIGEPLRFQPAVQRSSGSFLVTGRIHISANVPLGQYVLEVLVTDNRSSRAVKSARQRIDFEIVETPKEIHFHSLP
jgi:hypothetical protein